MITRQGQRIILTTTTILLGLAVFLLHATSGMTAPESNPGEVRMAVDPTVLPPILPSGEPEKSATEPEEKPEAITIVEEVELPEIDVRTPLPKPPSKAEKPKPVAPTKAAEKPAPKKEEKVADTPKPKPETASRQKTAKPTPKVETAPGQEFTPSPVAARPGKDAVIGIEVDSTDKEFVLTVTCNRPVGDTSYINLTNPRRLVVDLREKWLRKTRSVIRSAGGAVNKIVVGQHSDRLRLVVYFNTPPTANLTPQFMRVGDKLIVSAVLP